MNSCLVFVSKYSGLFMQFLFFCYAGIPIASRNILEDPELKLAVRDFR